MLRLCLKLPRKIAVAVSGGIDSMVVAHFLSNNHEVTVYNIDYGSQYSKDCINLICSTFSNLEIKVSPTFVRPTKNCEAIWREQRYDCFASWYGVDKLPIVLGHHLDDAVETYLLACLTGTPKHLPINGPSNTVRPFILNSKEEIISYAKKHRVPYLDDPTNYSLSHLRNKVRLDLIPEALKINSGLGNLVKRQIMKGLSNV